MQPLGSLPAWETAFDSAGRQYYFNRTTGETRWLPPFASGVQHRTPVPQRPNPISSAGTPTRPPPPPSFNTPIAPSERGSAGIGTGRRSAHLTSSDVANALGLGGTADFRRENGPASLQPTQSWQKKSTRKTYKMSSAVLNGDTLHAHHHSTISDIISQTPSPRSRDREIAGRMGSSSAPPLAAREEAIASKPGADRQEAGRAAREAFIAEIVERCNIRGYDLRDVAQALLAPARPQRSAERATDMMLRLRSALRAMPGGSLFSSLGRLVRATFCDGGDGCWISLEQFGAGLARLSLPFSVSEYALLFAVLDRAPANGFVAVDDFVAAVRGPMSERRLSLIQRAFATVDGSDRPPLGAVLAAIEFERSDRVVAQQTTSAASRSLFAAALAALIGAAVGGEIDERAPVPFRAFHEYFAGVSYSIASDDVFDREMHAMWPTMHAYRGASMPPNFCIRVTHRDGTQTIESLTPDAASDAENAAALVGRLVAQGVWDVVAVTAV